MYGDLLYALRILQRAPAFALSAVLTIALGMGASTAIFSVVDAVLLKPLPYAYPDRLVSVSERHLASPGLDQISSATARQLSRRSRTLEEISLYADGGGGRMTENGKTEIVRGQRVSPNFFDTLGIRAELGRVFHADDRLPGRSNVIVLSNALWKGRFGGDPRIIGRVLRISDRFVRVIGILPATYHPLHMSNPGEVPRVYQPLSIDDLEGDDRRPRGSAIARLKPGVTIGQARAEFNTILGGLVREHPNDYPRDAGVLVEPLKQTVAGRVRPILVALSIAAGFVIVITCANVANLLLIRVNARAKEVALRAALGASQWRLMRHALIESLCLSCLGGASGVFLAWAGITVLVALAPTEIPRVDEIRVDGAVLMFTLLASILAGVLFGAAPALAAIRVDLNNGLRGSHGVAGAQSRRRARHAFVIAEIACAFVLGIGGVLLARTIDELVHVNAGYDSHNVLTLTAFVYDDTPEKRVRHYQQIVERVRAIPGVEGAAMVSTVPLSQPVQNTVYVEGRLRLNHAEAPVVDQYYATPDYFRVMKIPLRRGRVFADKDGPGAPGVVIISESCAASLSLNDEAIGKRIRLGDRDGDGVGDWMTVVGIAGDVWQHGMDTGPSAGVYAPLAQHPDFYYRLLARTAGDPWRSYPAILTAMRELDPSQAIFHVQTMDDYVTKSLADRISAVVLIGLLCSLAFALAGIGIYGVVSYSVSLRVPEIAVRMALGADRKAVLSLILKELLSMLGYGVVIGFVVALALTRFLSYMLYHVRPNDLLSTVTVVLAISCVTLAAGFVPCVRAVRISPSGVLRDA